jgi:serine-type D-Ala-D-Ala carboxypeptidase (penicillin-binding protein 5/6)
MGLIRARSAVMAWLLLSLILPLFPAGVAAQDLVATPEISAQAAYVFDSTAGVELLAENSDERRAPASTVKIVTAMVVLDHAELDSEVVFDEADTASEEESRMGLVGGDTVTVEQLLVGLLLPSGNDAARALARHVGTILLDGAGGDPIERFVQEMNTKVAEAGLSNTNFTSPDGLDDNEDQYTTAYDLAHLGAMAMGYKSIAATVSQSTAEVTSVGAEARVYSLRNTNQFLEGAATDYATEGVVGLKSGSTSGAGACLVLAKRERGGNLVIAVVLGSEIAYDENGIISVDGRWEDMRSILSSVEDAFVWLNPESDRDVPGLMNEMAAWQVTLQDDSGILVEQAARSSIRYQLELLPEGPAKSEAGRVLFYAGPDLVAERPLIFR